MTIKKLPDSLSYKEQCALEVRWYEKHGKFTSRITRDAQGIRYVIGDLSWNKNRPNELVNRAMANYIMQKKTGLEE
jgi:hypothetical protein